jgi:hypothetical protein
MEHTEESNGDTVQSEGSKLTEADRKAIDDYVKTIAHEVFEVEIGKVCAEWGIRHARAEGDAKIKDMHRRTLQDVTIIKEFQTGETYQAQANRIAEQADKILNYENVMHEQDLKIAELEAEVAHWKDRFEKNSQLLSDANQRLMNDIIALQSPSAKDTPDEQSILDAASSFAQLWYPDRPKEQNACSFGFYDGAEWAIKRQPAASSVNDAELVELIQEIDLLVDDRGYSGQEFRSEVNRMIREYKAKAALSRASKQNEK